MLKKYVSRDTHPSIQALTAMKLLQISSSSTEPVNKQFNALKKLECSRFAIPENAIHKSIHKNVRVTMGEVVGLLQQTATHWMQLISYLEQVLHSTVKVPLVVQLIESLPPPISDDSEGEKSTQADLLKPEPHMSPFDISNSDQLDTLVNATVAPTQGEPNLNPLQGITSGKSGQVLEKPEVRILYFNGIWELVFQHAQKVLDELMLLIEFRLIVAAREIVEKNLDGRELLVQFIGNNSHDDYDYQQQFLFVYEQEPSYNQNYDDNYYPHELPSYPCCDYCGGSHKTFRCQPDNQNVNFSGSNQIQTLQYLDINSPSPGISNKEIFQAKGDLMKSIQTFLERFNCIPFEEKPQILFQTWETFFAIQCSQPEDSNESFQKLLKDLKELAEYDKSTNKDRPIFLNDNEDHPVQNKESPKNSSEETVVSNPNQEPPHDSDIHQLIEECSKKFFMYDKVEDLIKGALDTKLLSIKSQHPDNKLEQEVKNVEEQPAERRNHAKKSLQNFRVIHKNFISLNTSQISSVHADTPILSTKEPENSLSMGYEHLSITPETKSDEVTESNAKNLLPIPTECEVTSEDKRECDELVCENPSTIDYVDASVPDPAIASVEENVDHQEQEEINLEEISQVQDVVLREKLFSINRLIANIESLKDNPTPVCVFNSSTSNPIFEESDNSLFLPEFETFYDHTEETRSDNTTTHATDSLPEYDSFRFKIEPDQEELFNVVMNDISDDPSIPRPPPEPPDDDFDSEPEAISAVMENIDESFDPGGEIFISTKNEDVDHFPFMFVTQIFLPYLVLPEISPLFLSAESEDTIFDPGISD
nr:hypothetical protein [Tanacetum cinerariifolium]